jgi:hypothetical protein
MGVAVIASTSTSVRISLRRSLWRTPKRCSSSSTSRPRSANFDVLAEQAVGADGDVDAAVFEVLSWILASAGVVRRLKRAILTG